MQRDPFEPYDPDPRDKYPYHHPSERQLIDPALIVVASLVTLFVFASGILVGAVFF